MTPEQAARVRIDQLLTQVGWLVQDRAAMSLGAGLGVAVREYPLPAGPCDYLLFVAGKACGVIEAKPEGQTLIGVAEQSEKYMGRLPDHLASFGPTLLFDYESTGTETLFRDMRDPHPRSRPVFAFQKPKTLLAWATEKPSLRGRLAAMPPLDPTGLRQCQIEAIAGTDRLPGLERSLARGDPRILIQMATGAGKTFTACTFLYRLIKHAKVRRVLFLVDRTNLGDQTLRELQDYVPPDDNRRFTNLYVTQHLRSNRLDPDAKIVVTTIQRLFSMLKGEELPPEAEEHSAFEDAIDAPPRPVTYNPAIPIETFDIIVTDECHRSIYGQWRQVLDYFDATVIGLTATPSLHTLGFFGRNLVAEYPYERSVIDGVNVGFEVFRIKTEIGEAGGLIEAGFEVPVQDKKTRARRYQELGADLAYAATQLDRSVVAENQIRTVLEAYRTSLETELFPDREEVPKTLIFAKDDNHAENITRIAREVFGRGNDFAKKITYQTAEDPKSLLKLFRIARLPRIVVTVDMIATGTDVKPIEVLIFMRDVKSELYFEQMKGRGVRSIDKDRLLDVTPDARTGKERFVIVDAVGVTESRKTTMQPLERQRHTGFKQLLEHVASGDRRDDTLTTLASRLTRLDQKLEPEDRARIRTATGGQDLHEIATALMQATEAEALDDADPAAPETRERERRIKDQAARPIADNPPLRQLLVDLKTRAEIVIDEISPDSVVSTGFVERIDELFSQIEAGEAALARAKRLLERYRQAVLKAAVTGELTRDWRERHKADLEPADHLLARILQTRREAWEKAELEKLRAKGKEPEDDKWKQKYKEPELPDTSELPELPEGWVWATLPMLGEFGRGKSKHRPRNDPKLYGGNYPFIQTGDVRNSRGRISNFEQTYNDAGLEQSKLWPSGTICITIAANIAETGILSFSACFPDSVVGLVPLGSVNPVFVELFIRTAREDIDRYAPATAQKNINLEILSEVGVPLPPEKEQQLIAEKAEALLSEIDALETELEQGARRAAALRQSILTAAFTGKLVPQDPADEPAKALLDRIRAERTQPASRRRRKAVEEAKRMVAE